MKNKVSYKAQVGCERLSKYFEGINGVKNFEKIDGVKKFVICRTCKKRIPIKNENQFLCVDCGYRENHG